MNVTSPQNWNCTRKITQTNHLQSFVGLDQQMINKKSKLIPIRRSEIEVLENWIFLPACQDGSPERR